MPRKVFGGKKKSGDNKEFHLPAEVVDGRGNVVWKEWPINNRARDGSAPVIFDRAGKKIGAQKHGVVLGPDGKPLNAIILRSFTRAELVQMLSEARSLQDKPGVKWMSRRLKAAGITLRQIQRLRNGQEVKAVGFLLRDAFFRTAFLLGRFSLPERRILRVGDIFEAAQDYFFAAHKGELNSRRSQYDDSDRKLSRHGKEIVHATKYSRIKK